jgi:hypothetical protein
LVTTIGQGSGFLEHEAKPARRFSMNYVVRHPSESV